jgi:hypothetical protein
MGGKCVAIPAETGSRMVPFDVWGTMACGNPLSGVTLFNSDRSEIPFVTLSGYYDSEFDTLEVSTYHGEYLSDGFYNPVVACDRAYGGMPFVSVSNPMRAILVRAAKDSLTEDTLTMRIVLRDNTGVTIYENETTGRVIEDTVILSK